MGRLIAFCQTMRAVTKLSSTCRNPRSNGGSAAASALTFGPNCMHRWRVDIIRKKTEHLGIVTAPNAQEALTRAASLFGIEPTRYNKLMITKIDEHGERDCDW